MWEQNVIKGSSALFEGMWDKFWEVATVFSFTLSLSLSYVLWLCFVNHNQLRSIIRRSSVLTMVVASHALLRSVVVIFPSHCWWTKLSIDQDCLIASNINSRQHSVREFVFSLAFVLFPFKNMFLSSPSFFKIRASLKDSWFELCSLCLPNRVMAVNCDLQVDVNGEETFWLHKV